MVMRQRQSSNAKKSMIGHRKTGILN